MKSTSIIRQTIRTAIRDIREARRDRSIPCLMGSGWTIAAGPESCMALCIIDRSTKNFSYNFSGSWNRGTSYWTKASAAKILANLQASRPEMTLALAHHNDLRDRTEARAASMLASLLPIRNRTIG